MSDLENELLGLVEDDPHARKKRRSDSRAKAKTQAYADESDSGSDMDMDLESEEGEGDGPAPPPSRAAAVAAKPKAAVRTAPKGSQNPYPLEGRYIDEDDRDRLEAMPEIDRENVLAGRLEEMQKIKDSQQLDAMFRQVGGDDEEESDEEPNRKRRKHTSVSKEASRAMKDLKSKRKAKDERDARRALRRERRQRSMSASSSQSEEDGEISFGQSQVQPSYSRAYSPDAALGRRSPKRQDSQKDLDTLPPNAAELNAARLSRYEIVDMMYKDGFDELAKGAYIRVMAAEPDEHGRPKYRIQRIEEIDEGGNGRYSIEYKGRQISEQRGLLCIYGKAKRVFRIADVSNGDIEEVEFGRMIMTYRQDGVKAPNRSDLARKHETIKALRDRPMTSEEISRQVEARKQSDPGLQRQRKTIEITNLITARNLAKRRNDAPAVEDLERQIVALGGDPQTGLVVTLDQGQVAQNVSEYDRRLEKINENIQKKVREQMEKAHQGSLARKRAEDAIIKAKEARDAAAKAAAKAAEDAAEQGENAENGTDAVAAPVIVPSSSGPRKGETPQQFIARTVELDLGDF